MGASYRRRWLQRMLGRRTNGILMMSREGTLIRVMPQAQHVQLRKDQQPVGTCAPKATTSSRAADSGVDDREILVSARLVAA